VYKTVFILGAGASADAGVPVMRDFLDKARDFYSANLLEEKERIAFSKVFQAVHELKGASFYSKLDLNNVETVYSAFDMGRLLSRLGSISPGKINELNISIQKLIGLTVDLSTKLSNHPNRPPTVQGPYHAFAQFLQQYWKSHKDEAPTIITFNYDVALEYALHTEHEPYEYCLNEEHIPNAIPLYKLHGSVNWGVDEKNGSIQSWEMKDILKANGTVQPRNAKHSSLIVARNLQKRLKLPIAHLAGPILVPPTWSKGEYHARIGVIWQKAAKELSEAEAIYVIGYSLPDTDMFFRFLFALATHSESSIRRFWVFDPSETVKDRFLSMLGPGLRDEPRFHFEQCKFGPAITYLKKKFDEPY